MSIRLLVCLQLLAIAFSYTVTTSSSDSPLFVRLGAYPQSFDLRTIYYQCNFDVYEEVNPILTIIQAFRASALVTGQ